MAVFRVGCPHCGERGHVETAGVRLRRTRGRATYTFTCPSCGAAVRKPAGERIVELLVGEGVREVALHVVEG